MSPNFIGTHCNSLRGYFANFILLT